MATKKKPSPSEHNVDTGEIVEEASKALDARAQVAEFTTVEKHHAGNVGQLAEGLRQAGYEREHFIGVVRITSKDQSPVRVEFRLENGALNITEEANLNAIYGSSRPLLFGREKIVTEIINPLELLQELVNAGKNPFDYLDLSVKKGMDHALIDSGHVTTAEAILPRDGFLDTLNDIKSTMSTDAKTYTKNYLNGAVKPRVVLGTKGKA